MRWRKAGGGPTRPGTPSCNPDQQKGEKMDENQRHYEYEVGLNANNQIAIDCGGVSIITEYVPEEDGRPASRMSPAQLFFASTLG
jgi:hypothetical protein